MSRNNLSLQDTRTAGAPFDIGTFSETSLRYLTGKLGPKYEVISNGYGNGEYNHWYRINLSSPAWIIAIKGGNNTKRFNISFYDLNRTPISGRSIFEYDTVAVGTGTGRYYPYVNTVMQAQSDLYNTYDRWRLDKGDERYYPLEPGSYLLCVSAVRNEPFDYGVGLVIEFPSTIALFALEDGESNLFQTETSIGIANTLEIACPVITNTSIPSGFNGFSNNFCIVNPGITVTVASGSTWLIQSVDNQEVEAFAFELEPGDDTYFTTVHDHSLTEWQEAWDRDHHPDDKFPNLFIPFTN